MPVTCPSAALEQALAALTQRVEQAPVPPTRWAEEARRTAAGLVYALARLQGERALGTAVYAVSNRLLGEQPAQLVLWGSQTATLQRLLDSGTFWQWLRWASELPLPSLHEARWLSPLLAALPHWLGPVLQQAGTLHAQLEQALLPTSPLRVVLLATGWLLWSTHYGHTPPASPRTGLGQRVQQLPQALAHAEQLGRGARRLLQPPPPSSTELALHHTERELQRARAAWAQRQDCHPDRRSALARRERRCEQADRALSDALREPEDQRLRSLAALRSQAMDARSRLIALLDNYTGQAGSDNATVPCAALPLPAAAAGEQAHLLPALGALPVVLAAPRTLARRAGIALGATAGASLLAAGAWSLQHRAYLAAVQQAAGRMETMLVTEGHAVDQAALYLALARHVAALASPSADIDADQVARALDLPAPDGNGTLRAALRAATQLGPEVDDALVDDAAVELLQRERRHAPTPTQRPLPGLHRLADSTWRVHSQLEQAAQDDHKLILDLLWRAWEDLGAGRSVQLSGYHVQPHLQSPLYLDLREIRRCMSLLYEQADFVDRLYSERTPPRSLHVEDNQLAGRRVTSGVRVPLFPLQDNAEETAAWQPRTAALMQRLQTAVQQAGGYFHAGHPARLDVALRYYLEQASAPAPSPLLTRGVLCGLVQQLERALRARAGETGTPADERRNLLRLRSALQAHTPAAGQPPDARLRPDPLSSIGYELSLGANVLSQLSSHPTFLALCARLQADPEQVTFPASGDVHARALRDGSRVVLFPADAPPPGLEVLASMLRSVAQAVHGPVRSDGRLPLQALLTWYSLPALGVGGAQQVGACVDAVDARLQALGPTSGTGAPATPAVVVHRDYQHLAERLWAVHDAYPADLEAALAKEKFDPQPDPPSPLQTAWWEAQDALVGLFEHSVFWLRMRAAEAGFRGLRVDATGVTAQARDGIRRIRILERSDVIDDVSLRRQLQALYARCERFGSVEQSVLVPLPAALQFFDLAAPPPLETPSVAGVHVRMLPLIGQVHAQWEANQPVMSALDRDAAAIEQILARLQTGNPQHTWFRPVLETVPADLLRTALRAFDTLFSTLSLRTYLAANQMALTRAKVDYAGSLHLLGGTQELIIEDVAAHWPGDTVVRDAMQELRDIAGYLGGEVYSDGRLRLDDAIALQGGCSPLSPVSNAARIACTEQLLGELRSGMRGGYLRAQELLSPADLAVLRSATAAFVARQVPAGRSLLEHLAQPLVDAGGFAWTELHRSAYLLSEMARTPAAIALQRAVLTALNWYGGDGQPTSPTLLTTLTLEAVLADLGPASDREARVVLGYRLHKVNNWGRTFQQVRVDLEDYVRSLGRVPPAMVPMASLWLMQEYLPELLVSDLPAELVYASSVAAVNFVSGVHAAERVKRGLSQQMRFADLVTLSAELTTRDNIPQMVKRIALDARRLPTLDWFVFRQSHNPQPTPASTLPTQDEALQAFDTRVEEIEQAVSHLVAPLPYRLPQVEAALRQVFPTFPGALAPFPWNTGEIRFCGGQHRGHNFALHEIYAAGELRPDGRDWQVCTFHVPMDSPDPVHAERLTAWRQAFEQMRPEIARLPDINQQHRDAVNTYFENATRAYAVLIEEALMLRPHEERDAIMRGDVEIFTLRTHEPDLEAQQETRDDTDPYRGRFGVIYRLRINGQARCFQLFPLQSRIIPMPADLPLRLGGQLENRSVRLRSGSYVKIKVRRGSPLPVDWRAYISDVPPRAGQVSPVIVERLISYTPSDAPRLSPFYRLISPITRDFFWLDRENFFAESLGDNPIEAERKDPLWRKAVDFVVPFVENLRRIPSKDRHEFALAAFGLYLESILVVGPIASGLTKAIIKPAAAAAVPRFSAVSRVLVIGTLDALNPTAGTMALMRVGKDVVTRGTDRGVRFAWSLLDRSTSAARALTFGWTMREGMAVLDQGRSLGMGMAGMRTRTVNGMDNIMVIGTPTPEGSTLNLLDPATHLPYGPRLQERLSSAGSGAAAVLVKAGSAVNPPRAPSGKILRPVKTGTRTGGDDDEETRPALDPNRSFTFNLPRAP